MSICQLSNNPPHQTVMVQAEAVSLRARAKYESALIAIEDMQEGLEKLKGGLPELKRQASRSVTDIAKELKRGYLEEAFFQITGQRPPTRKGDDDGAAGSKTSERDAGAEKSGGTRGLQGPALAAASASSIPSPYLTPCAELTICDHRAGRPCAQDRRPRGAQAEASRQQGGQRLPRPCRGCAARGPC
jgi:hypothetical protein